MLVLRAHCVALLSAACSLAAASAGVSAQAFEKTARPLLKQHCFSCHGEKKQQGDVNLAVFATTESIHENRALWRRVIQQVESGLMPPDDEPAPSTADRHALARAVRHALDQIDCSETKDPGRPVLRRLNREEYNRTIRDLIGVDFDLADHFPEDNLAYGFDNVGSALSMPPYMVEKYLDAAEKVFEKAIIPQPVKARFEIEAMKQAAAPPDRTSDAKKEKGSADPPAARAADGGLLFAQSVEVATDLSLPAEGRYRIRVRAWQKASGNAPAMLGVHLDGRLVARFQVRSPRARLMQTQDILPGGAHRLSVSFLNPYSDPRQPDPTKRDRMLGVDFVEIEGPVQTPTAQAKALHEGLFFVEPGPALKARDAAKRIVSRFAGRAFRRPPTEAQVERLLRMYDLATERGEVFERAVGLSLQATLASPSFLFRIERDPDGAAAHRVDDHELAVRLSYFLWSSMPDAELFESAAQGRLHDPAVLEAQAKRMLADPRASSLTQRFAAQWLRLDELQHVRPDRKAFPEFDTKLRDAMRDEILAFFEDLMRNDRSVLELIDSDHTFVNETLAGHYELRGVSGDGMRRIKLRGDRRGGLLGMAGVLTLTSTPTRTSVTRRGKWVLDQLLGTPPPPPPPNAGDLAEQKSARARTLRERMQQHRADPQCASCHDRIDPLGFGFENYDAIGRWRTKDGPLKIDASGVLPSGRKFEGPVQLKKILLEHRDDFARALSEKMMIYALGRPLGYADTCAVRAIVDRMKKDEYRFSSMVLGVVRSVPFRYRRGLNASAE